MTERSVRRIFRFLKTKSTSLKLFRLSDPRRVQGREWSLSTLLHGVVLGMLSGCRSLKDTESLTARLAKGTRRLLGIRARIPDTTLRDILCRLDWVELREALHRGVQSARRSKTLRSLGFPIGIVAMDGKAVTTPAWDECFIGQRTDSEGRPYGLMMTVTSTLASAQGKPIIDVCPVPAHTNERGHFSVAFGQLVQRYGKLFTLVTYDAAATTQSNMQAVLKAGKHFLFRQRDERTKAFKMAVSYLQEKAPHAEHRERLDNQTEMVRRVVLKELPRDIQDGWFFPEVRTILKIESFIVKSLEGQVDSVTEQESRYWVSSLPIEKMTAEQWLRATVKHWAVETTHQILDVAFEENNKPWIREDPQGLLNLMILRRIATTLMALYKEVRARTEEIREMTWREWMQRVRDVCIAGHPRFDALQGTELLAFI